MLQTHIPILGFAAFSGTGKTTLLTQLIPILKNHKLRIGLIKHSHHNFEIDQPGKDSYRLRKAGAISVLLASKHRRAIITEIEPAQEPKLADQLQVIDQSNLDLILVEGFKAEIFPKIEIHRPALNKPLIYPNDPNIIAVASDSPLELPKHLPGFDLNNPDMIADYILNQFLERKHD
ncbi:molybdopterin-guanine dinucleotide biosynthesis protein B [Methylotuvimicrobium buryatense]|uniref:Molybdopterin-guanine dinucleotide biosynthesis protein B n=1 Tax=Methylotuvimicrobium buryatense TaxID=95641 RepID=A0A4P9UN86_METBY|nr:molybdopterin-guanine dinucleotide biosynthesis protein B [Methylotuvimicrobium buryatense]QCW82819.1 molybdopterin-guanine dinucleotide biosynthesis protein B [Methylotuvimicrobium buryatense]